MTVTINGSAGVTTNSGAVYDSLQRATAVTASGTSVDFTSIPSWVRRITVMFSGVSTSGTSNIQIQIGAGSFTTSGYVGTVNTAGGTNVAFSAGFVVLASTAAANLHSGQITITNITGNTWVESSSLRANVASSAGNQISAGNLALSSTLDRIRITTVNGTDTFDAGTINIIYE